MGLQCWLRKVYLTFFLVHSVYLVNYFIYIWLSCTHVCFRQLYTSYSFLVWNKGKSLSLYNKSQNTEPVILFGGSQWSFHVLCVLTFREHLLCMTFTHKRVEGIQVYVVNGSVYWKDVKCLLFTACNIFTWLFIEM
jgi:hypothetical protein